MITRKAFCIALSIILSLGLFATGAAAHSGYLGDCIGHCNQVKSQHQAGVNTASSSHDCCNTKQKDPCDFEKGPVPHRLDTCVLTVRGGSHNPTGIGIVASHPFFDSSSFERTVKHFRTRIPPGHVSFYLQNLSLLC